MTKKNDAVPDSRPKRKKVDVNDNPEQQKANKKRKKVNCTVPPVISDVPSETNYEAQKNKKEKKQKKKKTAQNEILDPPTCPEVVHEGEEDLSPEERRALERKMKKILKKEEKKMLKEQGETHSKTDPAGPTAGQLALDYLTCWAENRVAWKFQKTRQTWLLQHMFDSEKVSDDKFAVLLQYLEGLQGAAKDTTIQKALGLVQHSGEAPNTDVQQRAHRAREVVQLLS
ncbi:protein cholesin [Eucyclogobius newberryi]|uniref:protein cholesin n=1 Tax=Eucyclogobius newberryi TaxID=166745 RepID=UPI003B5968B4